MNKVFLSIHQFFGCKGDDRTNRLSKYSTNHHITDRYKKAKLHFPFSDEQGLVHVSILGCLLKQKTTTPYQQMKLGLVSTEGTQDLQKACSIGYSKTIFFRKGYSLPHLEYKNQRKK